MSSFRRRDFLTGAAAFAAGVTAALAGTRRAEAGDRWVHLRLCLTCGHVGCCDSSPNQHATKHFHATGHPIMKSAEPGEDWGWCYIDQIQLDSL